MVLRFSVAIHHATERLASLVAPLGRALMSPERLGRARFVPGPPRMLFGPFRRFPRRWQPFTREVPAELLTTPGIRRDPVQEAAAFRQGPVPVWHYLHSDASLWSLYELWRALLPISPLFSRATHRARTVSAEQPQTAPSMAADSAALTRSVKAVAMAAGASATGVAAFDPKYITDAFQGAAVGDRVFVLTIEQDWRATQTAPSARAERAAFSGYTQALEVATKVAEDLHARGYTAALHSMDGEAIEIHYALEAGLGQLGLNGQLLTPQAGSRCRLMSICTDAPLELDAPVDYGITTLCDNCRACVDRCPAGAIPRTRKLHRGVEKIKINTSRCMPLVAQAEGCAVCMKVCPIQRYGLEAVLDEWELSGTILGRGTDELEGYTWLDGRRYGPGERPSLSRDFFSPPGTNWDFKRQAPPDGTRRPEFP